MNIQNDVWKTKFKCPESGSVAVQQCLVTVVKLCVEQCELHPLIFTWLWRYNDQVFYDNNFFLS